MLVVLTFCVISHIAVRCHEGNIRFVQQWQTVPLQGEGDTIVLVQPCQQCARIDVDEGVCQL